MFADALTAGSPAVDGVVLLGIAVVCANGLSENAMLLGRPKNLMTLNEIYDIDSEFSVPSQQDDEMYKAAAALLDREGMAVDEPQEKVEATSDSRPTQREQRL